MRTRKVYHYSTEDYADDRQIASTGDHFGRLTDEQKNAENVLRSASPKAKNIRATSLYTWENRDRAETLWRHRRGCHLYELRIDEDDIRHVGDVQHYTNIMELLKKGESTDVERDEYWGGTRIGDRIEILVSKAKVLRRIKNDKEHKSHFAEAIEKLRVDDDKEPT